MGCVLKVIESLPPAASLAMQKNSPEACPVKRIGTALKSKMLLALNETDLPALAYKEDGTPIVIRLVANRGHLD